MYSGKCSRKVICTITAGFKLSVLRILESCRLEKSFKITESHRYPNAAKPTRPGQRAPREIFVCCLLRHWGWIVLLLYGIFTDYADFY